MDGLLDQYPPNRVQALGVVSNAGESFAAALASARERGVRMTLVHDENGQVAETLEARSTPTVVLLDRQGRRRFLGWFDNERLPGDPQREPWLEWALNSLLSGNEHFSALQPVYGCRITRALFQTPQDSCCQSEPWNKEIP
jgi:hypothetical protein